MPHLRHKSTTAVLGGRHRLMALSLAAAASACFAQAPPLLAYGSLYGAPQSAVRTFMPSDDDPQPCSKPQYPLASLRHEEQGTVTMSFLVGVDGKVRAGKILRSSGFRLLDNAALEGIAMCRFKPGTENGQVLEQWVPVQYVWTLQ